MDFSSRKIKNIKPSIFAEFNKKKNIMKEQGVEVIDLGIGAPDKPAPDEVVEELYRAAIKPENHKYSPFEGCYEYRKAVSDFYMKEYNVTLDPHSEVLTLIGSKEGIFNLIQAVVDPEDTVLIPNPGYPTYRTAVNIVGANEADLMLDKTNNYEPMLNKVSELDRKNAKLMLTNYPNNPTTAVVNKSVYDNIIAFAKKNKIIVANDTAYNLVTFEEYRAPSLLEASGAKEIAVEFGSLSKSFNMTGWRIGYVVGNKKVIQAIKTLKSNMDTGQFLAIQKAAVHALKHGKNFIHKNNEIFYERMKLMYEALTEMGFKVLKPKGTIFLWVEAPKNYTSVAYSEKLLEEVGVIVTPGTAFGSNGEGYFRISLTVELEILKEVIARMKRLER